MGIRRKKRKYNGEDGYPGFVSDFTGTSCWICLGANYGLSPYDKRITIDHIAGRNSRNANARTNLGWVCWRCHRDRIPSMSMQDKVLLKIKNDPQGFDEVKFAAIRKCKGGRIDF